MMAGKAARLVVMALLLGTLVPVRCKKPERDIPAGTVGGNATVVLPAGCPVAYSDIHLTAGVFDETDVDASGAARIGLRPEAVSAVVAATTSGTPLLYHIAVTPTEGYSVTLDARSTAEALVFLHPYVVQSNPGFAATVMSLVKNAAETNVLAQLVSSRLSTNGNYLTADDTAFAQSVLAAVKVIQSQIDSIVEGKSEKQNANPGRVMTKKKPVAKSVNPPSVVCGDITISGQNPFCGVGLRAEQIVSDSYRLWIKNDRRRYLGAFLRIGAFDNYVDSTYVLSSSAISILPPKWTRPESSSISFNAARYPSTWLLTYGLGLYGVDDWLNDPHKSRITMPAIRSSAFDICAPLFSVITGISGLMSRGSPQTEAILALADPVLSLKITDAVQRKNVIGIIKEVSMFLLKRFKDHPENLVALAQEVGISITGAQASTIVGKVPFVSFLFQCVDAFNFGWTSGTIMASYIEVYFNITYQGSGQNHPPNTPSTPSGPSSGQVGVSYSFSSSATDPDGDAVLIRFAWGDGDTSDWAAVARGKGIDGLPSGRVEVQPIKAQLTANLSFASLTSTDATLVRLSSHTAKSLESSEGHPAKAFPPRQGQSPTDRLLGSQSHAWSASGTYSVTAQARDEHGALSAWSAAHRLAVSGGTTPPKWSLPLGLRWSSPAINQAGLVLAASRDSSTLFAVRANGSVAWRSRIGRTVGSSPAVGDDGTAYTVTDAALVAVDANGSEEWRLAPWIGYWCSSPAIGSDNTLYLSSSVATDESYLCAIQSDGNPGWSLFLRGWQPGTPVVGSDGCIYVSCSGVLHAVNPDGGERWQASGGGGALAIGSDGTIYSSGGYFVGIAATSSAGSTRWYYEGLGGDVGFTGVSLASDGTVYAGGTDERLYAIEQDGTLRWTTIPGNGAVSTPAVLSDGSLCALADSGRINIVSSSGNVVWSAEVGDNIVSSVTVGSDSTLYLAGESGRLYAYAASACLAGSAWPMFLHDSRHTGRAGNGGANSPPLTPGTPSGPSSGWTDSSYSFTTVTTDPDGDAVRYILDWGTGAFDTTAYYASGETIAMGHVWYTGGTYNVRAQAFDSHGAGSGWSPAHSIVISGGANRAPNTPGAPTGPDSAYVDSTCNFDVSTTDPDGDNIRYVMNWGDGALDTTGYYSSGETIQVAHAWSRAGAFSIRAKAQDQLGASSGWSSAHVIRLDSVVSNNPPNTPMTPSGPDSGYVDSTYSFSTSTIDPDGDSICYRFAWGDGDTSAWSSFANGGSAVSMSHVWSTTGSYNVKAQAEDAHGATSSWSGRHQISIVRGGVSYPDTVVATVPVGSSPDGAAALPNGSYVYVANYNSGTVSVIRTSDNTVVATVPVGANPRGVAALPDGSNVYVANDGSNTVSVIRTSDNTVVATVPVGVSPYSVAALPNGSYVYVANYFSDAVSVIRTSDNTIMATVPVGAWHRGVAALPNGSYVYAADEGSNAVSVIRTSDNTVVDTVPVGASPYYLAALPNGGYVYVGNSLSNAVSVIRTSDNAVVATVPVGARPAGVAALPNGSYVYVASKTDSSVSVIRTSDNAVVATVPVGARPAGVAALPNGSYVYVANQNGNSVSVLGLRSLGSPKLSTGSK
jgi:YVTN family beta-propeller protein